VRSGCLQRSACVRALRSCCALCVCALGRPPAELRAGVRWAKQAGLAVWLRRSGAAKAAGGRSFAGGGWAAAGRWGEGRGGEGGLTDMHPPGCYLFRRDGMSRQLFL
jgi:hypothetical protein